MHIFILSVFSRVQRKNGKSILETCNKLCDCSWQILSTSWLPSTVDNLPSTVSNLRYLPCVLYNRIYQWSDVSFYSILFSPFSSIFFPFLWIPGLRFLCLSSIFPLFPLHFPRVYACAHLPNARVNIIRCTPFRLSSYIREKYVLQHPYNSTL